MDWAALGTAFLAWLKEISPWMHDAIVAGLAIWAKDKIDEGTQAKDALESIKRADDAAAEPVPDVLRDLQQRGRVRDL